MSGTAAQLAAGVHLIKSIPIPRTFRFLILAFRPGNDKGIAAPAAMK